MEELKHSNYNDLLSVISNHSEDAIWFLDKNQNYIFVNEKMTQDILFAKDCKEPIGKPIDYYIKQDASHTIINTCNHYNNTILQTKQSIKVQHYVISNGKNIEIELIKTPFYDTSGDIAGIMGICKNITIQKQIQDELTIKTKLIESGPVVVFAWSGEDGWPVKYVSSNVKNMLGVDAKSFKSQSIRFSEFIHFEDLERVTQEVNNYLTLQTTSFQQEYRIHTADKKIIWVEDYTIVTYLNSKPQSINGYLIDITEKKTTEEANLKLANFDTLTNLPNRQKFNNDIKHQGISSCVIFNIDSFKEINDLFGIAAADAVLQQVANWFIAVGLVPYRIAGDEFAFIFDNKLSLNQVIMRTNSIISLFESQLFRIGQETITLRLTAGVATSSGDLLTKADIALHLAKERKLPFCIYEETENIEDKYRKNIAIATKVRHALMEDKVICHYQPIISFYDKEIKKYEALVRVIDKNNNLIPPNDFLAIAKKTKLYPRITKEVIKKACRLFSTKTEEFSVNLSITDIENEDTVNEIFKTIISTKTANKIVFELVESEQIQNYNKVADFIHKVKNLGSKIAIDDFGTGYSNFEHILNLNVDYLKIDGSLIKNINENKRHKIIVETIVDFAHKINAQTIAEYVCSEEVFNTVAQLGVDFSQGYYTGKPQELN